MGDTGKLVLTMAAVAGLVLLVSRYKLNAFIALVLASLAVGAGSGMRLPEVAKAFQEGVGGTLGFIAVVVGLGTMLGKMLAESGGAGVVAETLTRLLGERRLPWTLLLVSFIVGLPVFFGVGLVLLVPVLFTIARDTQRPLMTLGLPVVAGLSVAHGLVPPHPGPLVAIEKLGADTGMTILYSLIVGLPTAVVAGPLFGRWMGPRVTVPLGGLGMQLAGERRSDGPRPGFGLTLFTILLPVLLMLLATVVDVVLDQLHLAQGGASERGDVTVSKAMGLLTRVRPWTAFLGTPLVAMLVAVLFSFYSFGRRVGFDRVRIARFMDDCVGPAAGIMLVVGAGGGFSKVLDAAGVAAAIASSAKDLPLSPLLLGWVVAALIRVAVGSATVAITMAASIVSPIALAVPGTNKELLVLSMGAGSLILSHLNDGGFWFVKEYLNLSVVQTLKTWTVMETLVSVTALGCILLLDLVL